MTLASDQNPHPDQLSPIAQRMQALREDVIACWEQHVRVRIAQATTLRHPILVDTMPSFYDNIVESVSLGYPRSVGSEGNTLAYEHGGERARLTAYDHAALIEEYQILRWAIFRVVHEAGVVLGYEEAHAVNASIDIAVQQASEAFSLVHSGLRERLAAALTHDLRSPLAATTTALELILMSDDPARMKALAGRALGNTRRMGTMIAELLDTMAYHGGQQMQLDLVRMDVQDVLREIQSDGTSFEGHEVQWMDCPIEGWWDRRAIKRAIENLLSNAVKYGRPDAPVTVRPREVHGRLQVLVHNTGEPIPPDEQECIFQMYRRARAAKDGAKQGWGIGLPYVRAVAESHGGSINLDSSAERGTTFILDVPLDARPYRDAPSLATGSS